MEKIIENNIPSGDMLFFNLFEDNQIKTAGMKENIEDFVTGKGVDDEVYKFLKSDKFKPDKKNNGYLIMSAMGAEEAWGSNMNCDSFKESELLKSYKTFENGYAFEEHENKDPKKAVGKILFSWYNKKMRRVELVVEVFDKNEKGKKFMDKLWQVSMGTKIEYDVCPVCGNKAKVKKDYCVHIKKSLGKIMPDGTKVVMENVGCKFFDISFVRIAADLTGRTLEKIASKIKKVAEIEKEVENNLPESKILDLNDIVKKVYKKEKLPDSMEVIERAIKEGRMDDANFYLKKFKTNSK